MALKFTGVVDHQNQRIINVGSPSLDTDAVNKLYVDNVAQGLDWKQSVRAASTGNVSVAAPGATLDGVTLAANDRFLLKDQTDGSENGVYVFNGAASAATRATDANTSAKVTSGLAVAVEEGTVNGDKNYILVTNAPITLNTTSLVFSVMGGGGTTYTAGNGIDVSGTVVSAHVAVGGGVLSASGGLSVDPSVVVRKFSMNVGDGSSTSITVPHNLGTRDVTVEVFTNGAPYDTVMTEVERTDINNVSLVFGTAPASAAYRVVVHG